MNGNNPDIEEKIFKRIPKEILILSLVLSVGAFIVFDLMNAVLLLFGGITAVLSFIWLKSSITRLLAQEKKKALKSAAFLYGIRLVLIIAMIFIIIFFFQNKVLAFAAGFSTIIVVMLIEGAAAALKIMKWKS
jgi:hypothetical protein